MDDILAKKNKHLFLEEKDNSNNSFIRNINYAVKNIDTIKTFNDNVNNGTIQHLLEAYIEQVGVEGNAWVIRLTEAGESILATTSGLNYASVLTVNQDIGAGATITLPEAMRYRVGTHMLLVSWNGTVCYNGEQYEEIGAFNERSAIIKIKQDIKTGDKLEFRTVALADTASVNLILDNAITSYAFPVGSSTTNRTLSERFTDIINVKDFGAKGDSVTNDTIAVQSFLTYLATNGGVGYIPKGTYLISGQLDLRSNVYDWNKPFAVYGAGSSLTIIKETLTANIHTIRLQNVNNARFQGMTIDAGRSGSGVATNAGACVYCLDCSNITLKDCIFEKFEFCGVMSYLSGTQEIKSVWHIEDCIFDGSSFYNPQNVDAGTDTNHSGLLLVSVKDSYVSNCFAYKCTGYGLELKGYGGYSYGASENCTLVGCKTELCNRGGWYFGGENTSVLSVFHKNISVIGLQAKNCKVPFTGGRVNGLNASDVVICYDGNYPFASYTQPIYFTDSSNLNIRTSIFNTAQVPVNFKSSSHCNVIIEYLSTATGVYVDLLGIDTNCTDCRVVQDSSYSSAAFANNTTRDKGWANAGCIVEKATGKKVYPAGYVDVSLIGSPTNVAYPSSSFEGKALVGNAPGYFLGVDSADGGSFFVKNATYGKTMSMRFKPQNYAIFFNSEGSGSFANDYVLAHNIFYPARTESSALGRNDNKWLSITVKNIYTDSTFTTSSSVDESSIDLSSGTVFTKSIAADTTFTFTGVPVGKAAEFTLLLSDGGAYTVTWPSSVKWAGGVAPTLTSSGIDVLYFLTPDGGTTWYGWVNSANAL